MNILPMRYFMTVVEKEGITAAANELFITQQTLSAHMASLEKELGCTLFIRKPYFRLTGEGTVFLSYCRKMVNLDENLHKEFAEINNDPVGILKVGISQTRSRLLLPHLATAWLRKYPRVRIEISEMSNEQILRDLAEGRLDIGIGNLHDRMPELEVHNLYQENLLLLIPKTEKYSKMLNDGVPNTFLKFAGEPFLMQTGYDILGRYGKQLFEAYGLVPDIVVISDNAETCIDMCADGAGLYICPDLFLKGSDKDNLFYTLDLELGYMMSAATRKNFTYQSRLITEFIDDLIEETANKK